MGVQILSFSCSFLQKILQNNTNLGVGVPTSGKSWIRHWKPIVLTLQDAVSILRFTDI